MRWPAYFILAYVAVGLQIGLSEFLRVGSGARPDLILLAVIFIAINAPRDAALLGALGIGLMTDLVTIGPLGLYALAYSLAATFTVSTQEMVYKSHPVTHFTLGLVGGLLGGLVVLIHGWIKGPGVPISAILGSALYTAILAPVVLGLLNLVRGAFSFSSPSRRRARHSYR
ncbi:MAG: rod shape-determining protein MreD [Tepidisphaeraceae bacterium]